jgi:hypothetical protein
MGHRGVRGSEFDHTNRTTLDARHHQVFAVLVAAMVGIQSSLMPHSCGGNSSLAPSAAAAGERPAISRHSCHWSCQVAARKRFAPMTRNAKPLAARVMQTAFASCARPFVWVVPFYGIDPMGGRCGSFLRSQSGSIVRTRLTPSRLSKRLDQFLIEMAQRG